MDEKRPTNGEAGPVPAATVLQAPTTEELAVVAAEVMQQLGVDGLAVVALTPSGLVVGACAADGGPTDVVRAMLAACKPVFDAVDREVATPMRPCPSCRGEGKISGYLCIACKGAKRVPR